MDSDTAVNVLLALAGLSFFAGLLAVGRVLWRARGFPKTALQMISLAGGFFCLVAGSTLIYFAWHFQGRLRAAVEFQGRPVPQLHYRPAAGGPLIRNESWRGKTVLLNVWATWCRPCRAELPALANIQKAYASRLLVVAVSDEESKTVADFVKANRYELDLSVVARGAHDPAPFFFNLPVRPLTFLVDPAGVIRETRVGAMDEREMRQMLAPHLK